MAGLMIAGVGLLIIIMVAAVLFAPRTVGNPPDWSHLQSTGISAFWPPLEDTPYYDPETGDLIPHTREQAREYNELLEQIGEYGFDTFINDFPYGISEQEFRTRKAFMLKRWMDGDRGARP